VKRLSGEASDRREDNGAGRSGTSGSGNILMHHSRDTAEKQWAETRFLTLAGVARVFNAKRRTLQQLGKTVLLKLLAYNNLHIVGFYHFVIQQFLFVACFPC